MFICSSSFIAFAFGLYGKNSMRSKFIVKYSSKYKELCGKILNLANLKLYKPLTLSQFNLKFHFEIPYLQFWQTRRRKGIPVSWRWSITLTIKVSYISLEFFSIAFWWMERPYAIFYKILNFMLVDFNWILLVIGVVYTSVSSLIWPLRILGESKLSPPSTQKQPLPKIKN